MKKYTLIPLLITILLSFSGCGDDDDESESSTTVTQGWHFQGRDCLACHNQDLSEDKHLLLAGTVYKSADVVDHDNEENACGGALILNLLDENFNTVYSSKEYETVGSSGYNGKGNIFILQRELRLLSAQTYSMQITSADGVVLAASGYTHSFTSQDYDVNNNEDFNNRLSCNACHVQGGVTTPLYAKARPDLCN